MKIIEVVKKSLYKFLAFFPSRLPIGDGQFEAWFNSIAFTYDLPKNDSVRFALSTAIMHASPSNKPGAVEAVFNSGSAYYRSKRYFGLTLLKGACNQTAHQIIADCKLRQDERKKAEAEAAVQASENAALGKTTESTGPKLAEAPAPSGATSDVQKPQGPSGQA